MKKFLFKIILLSIVGIVSGHYAFANTTGDNVIISEIEYDPAQGYTDQSYEWFELYNPSVHNIDISGWQFTDGEGAAVIIPNATNIASGDYFLAVYNTVDFQTEHVGVIPDLEYGGLANANYVSFANDGDELTIQDGLGIDVDFVSWEGHTVGWDIIANAGESITRATSVDTDVVADWQGHQTPTPGTGSLTVINHAPTNITLSNDNQDENISNITIGLFSTTDQDNGDTHTYSFTCTTPGADDGSFYINGSNQLRVIQPFDYETKNSYLICMRTTDAHGLNFDKNFTITVNDVNENPVITSNGGGDTAAMSVVEGQTAVTTVTATDQDIGSIVTYSILTAVGTDGDKFNIDTTTGILTFITAPDFENPTDLDSNNDYVLHVIASDGVNQDLQTITVIVTKLQKSSNRNGFGRISKERLAEIFGKVDSKKEQVKNKCSFIYSRLIRFGTHGEDVKALQVTLNALGFNTGVADGWYGPNTYKGIVAFQNVMKIAHDGIFGPQSTEKLMKKCSA